MKILHPIIVIAVVLAACTLTPASAKTKAERENDIREVLFRRMMPRPDASSSKANRKDPASELPKFEVYFISYWSGGKSRDPDATFLKRFSGHIPQVKKESDSYVDESDEHFGWSNIRDKQTHQRGIRYSIGHIIWLSRSRVRARAGHEAGAVNAFSADFELRFAKGHWTVVSSKNFVVS